MGSKKALGVYSVQGVICKNKLYFALIAICVVYLIVANTQKKGISRLKRERNDEIHLNLMQDFKISDTHVQQCTLEYANTHKLQQDHPCVIDLIKRLYLKPPSPREEPYGLHQMEVKDPSAGQTKAVMRILRKKKSGFFIECGASDGEFLSNTLYLERFGNWSGILIEPEPRSYEELMQRKRKSWTVPACLSLEPYPTEVKFNPRFQVGNIQTDTWFGEEGLITVQCFPLYSILLAYGRTFVDFFSLDVEGHELAILKTVPWHKVDMRVLAVEWEHIPEGPEALVDFMYESGFINFGKISTTYARDYIFVKDYLRDLRWDDYDYEETDD